ncbi:ABC transporter ATP-binding protein [Spiroplasma clarkii]|uniref:ABC transporter ATP-binding protein n=1 Tax=Spiroplasma clarkii TaxID=2139 RepID=A0A1Y0KZV3_9MOLU|nr:ABC transporter ATP-binding protein [Spiroplasma clarkii]ARU91060.1 ABC transporter ATP-binding protein [Spiroplasma clarkii]ATX70496.1 ABC transporter ATP-binding protein [Spiroplasma clarkii]
MLVSKDIFKEYSKNAGNFGISLTVNDGEVYGIMGPNGAGKSTFIRQILGFIKPDKGEILVHGLAPYKNSEKIMDFCGYIPGEIALYDGLSGLEYLKIAAKLKSNIEWEFVEKLIDFFGLDVKRKIKKMSSGMKQKVAIIAAVVHKPKFLVLDEPTRGLDGAATEQFKDLILKFKNEFQTTIIFCSHIFDEILKTCDRVGFISEGVLAREFEINDSSTDEIQKEFIRVFKTKAVGELFDENI